MCHWRHRSWPVLKPAPLSITYSEPLRVHMCAQVCAAISRCQNACMHNVLSQCLSFANLRVVAATVSLQVCAHDLHASLRKSCVQVLCASGPCAGSLGKLFVTQCSMSVTPQQNLHRSHQKDTAPPVCSIISPEIVPDANSDLENLPCPYSSRCGPKIGAVVQEHKKGPTGFSHPRLGTKPIGRGSFLFVAFEGKPKGNQPFSGVSWSP